MARRSALASRHKDFPPTVVEQLRHLERDLGGRQALVGMLTLAPLTQDLRSVLGLLGDPDLKEKSLAEICALGNLLPGELMRLLGAAALLRGQTLAQQKIGDGLAAVAEDVVRRAAPYTEPCTDCMVLGEATGRLQPDPTPDQPNPESIPCPTCQGTKLLRYQPDFERQKLALEMGRLLPKGGGINIANMVGVQGGGSGTGGGAGSLEKLQLLTDSILYDEDDSPLEGEVVSPANPDRAPLDPGGVERA